MMGVGYEIFHPNLNSTYFNQFLFNFFFSQEEVVYEDLCSFKKAGQDQVNIFIFSTISQFLKTNDKINCCELILTHESKKVCLVWRESILPGCTFVQRNINH